MTRHDGRHKSVRDRSRRVSEATTTVCVEGRRGGRERIDSTSKAGTTGSVGIGPSAVSRTFQNESSCSSGYSKILTLTSARGIFSIPQRREHRAPMTASPRHYDSTLGQLANDTHRPEPRARLTKMLWVNSVLPGHSCLPCTAIASVVFSVKNSRG